MHMIFRYLSLWNIGRIFFLILLPINLTNAQSAINFGGSVVDSRRQTPISSARVLLELWSKAEPMTTFTNASGVFSFSVPVGTKTWPGRIVVSDPNYERLEVLVNVSSASKPQEFSLQPLIVSSTVSETKTVTSPPVYAFPGSNWSPWVEICSTPLDADEQIGATLSFDLVGGDRKCNAWAECRETVHDRNRICWQFHFQGHDEWRNRGPFGGINNSSGPPNAGRLVYEILHTQTGPPPESQLGYVGIQFAGERNVGSMLNLKVAIEKRGTMVVGLERVDKTYASSVKYFHEEDRALAQQLIDIVALDIVRTGISAPQLEKVEGLENKVRVHYVEIWLH
jgi:hypothetical protein